VLSTLRTWRHVNEPKQGTHLHGPQRGAKGDANAKEYNYDERKSGAPTAALRWMAAHLRPICHPGPFQSTGIPLLPDQASGFSSEHGRLIGLFPAYVPPAFIPSLGLIAIPSLGCTPFPGIGGPFGGAIVALM